MSAPEPVAAQPAPLSPPRVRGRSARRHGRGPTQLSARERKRLWWALVFSLLVHALLLLLAFGGDASGLPGLNLPWRERRGEVPELRVTLSPVPAAQQPIAEAPAAVPALPPLPEPPEQGATVQVQSAAPAAPTVEPPLPQVPQAPPPERVAALVDSSVRPAPALAPLRVEPQALAIAEPREAPRLITMNRPPDRVVAPPVAPPASSATARVPEPPVVDDRLEREAREAAERRAAEVEAARVAAARLQAEREQAARITAAREAAALQETALRVEAERRERERAEAARQEAARQEAVRVEAARAEAALPAAVREENARLAAARAEALRLEAERQDRARQQLAAREEAARREAARFEAARADAARLEAERAETQRQEAERQARLAQQAAQPTAAQEAAARREARLREIGQQLNEEAAQREAAANAARQGNNLPSSWSSARRGRLFGRADANAELVLYAEAWSRKIQLGMGFDTIRETVKRPHTSPLVTVAIRRDGSVESVTFVVTSGVPEIDEAIRRIIQGQMPYQAFSPALAREFDVIEIRRTWYFDTAIRLQ